MIYEAITIYLKLEVFNAVACGFVASKAAMSFPLILKKNMHQNAT